MTSINGPLPGTDDTTAYAFDAARRLTRVGDPLGGITRYEFDADGLLRKTRKARVAAPNETSLTELRIPLKAGHHSGGCRASVPVHAGPV